MLTRAQFRRLVEPLPCGHKPQGAEDIGKLRCAYCQGKVDHQPALLQERLPTAEEIREALETCLPCGHPPKSYLNAERSMCEACYYQEQRALTAVKEQQYGIDTVLLGSEKQVAFARTIRVQKLDQIDKRRAEGSLTPKLLDFAQKLRTERNARWFITIRTVRIAAKSPGRRAAAKAVGKHELRGIAPEQDPT